MKRLLLLSLCLMMGLLSFAHDFEVDGIYYNITSSSSLTVAVTYKGTSSSQYSYEYTGNVTIPATVIYSGKTYSVTSIGSDAFYECSDLTSITIPNSVTSIGSWAFSGCRGLKSITIPNSVTSIGNYAFYGCSGLATITIGSGVTTIGSNAFGGCNSLSTLTLHCPKVGSQWFRESSITEVIFGEEVTSIGYEAFAYCSGLTSITIPSNVTNIESRAFSGCSGLTSIYVPKGSLSLFYNFKENNCTIYEVDGDIVLSELSFRSPTTFSTYYDYDGDGVMEYLSTNGFYDKQGNLKKEIPDMRFGYGYGTTLATPINGQGELLVYDYEHDRDYFYRPEEYYENVVGHDELQGNTYSLLADIDNDGRKDLVSSFSSGDKFTIFYQQPDGTFKAMEQSAVMDQDAAKIAQSSSGGGGIAPFSQGMMVKAPKHKAPGSSSFETGYCTGVDMNDDGILDLMNNGTSVLYSYADNKFFIGTKDKSLYPCDLNGDGELDYVCYDGNNLVLQTRTFGTIAVR